MGGRQRARPRRAEGAKAPGQWRRGALVSGRRLAPTEFELGPEGFGPTMVGLLRQSLPTRSRPTNNETLKNNHKDARI